MESPNIYLTLVLIGITIIVVKKLNIFNQNVEHFGNPLELIQKLGKGMMDFFLSLLDIFLIIGDVFSWIALIPFIIMDLILLCITWLWPITLIKGVITAIFTIVKILLVALFDFIIHILRMLFAKIFGFLKGGLWGLPHTPDEHHSHNAIYDGYGSDGDPADEFGDHHHNVPPDQYRYRPLRCYKGISHNGFINIVATIICPPLGVFMAFGLKGYIRIIMCCLLSLAYYVPGLVYALLITTELGIGRTITAKDCGGIANYGLRIAGCTALKTKTDCEAAKIPGWRDANGDEIRACGYDETNKKCYNIIYPAGAHTLGDNTRFMGEVGGRYYNSDVGKIGVHTSHAEETHIDRRTELADDIPNKDGSINYDPIGLADSIDKEIPEGEENNYSPNISPEDRIPIPEGPWRFVGESA